MPNIICYLYRNSEVYMVACVAELFLYLLAEQQYKTTVEVSAVGLLLHLSYIANNFRPLHPTG